MEVPKTRYARSADGTFIAYQVFGNGPVDLLWISPWLSELEMMWEYRPIAKFHLAMAKFARVILLDQRGIGLSDRTKGFPDLETRMDDVRAVLDAVGSDRTVLWGAGPDGGALVAMYAATYPDRVQALAFWQGMAKSTASPDFPWGVPDDEVERFEALVESAWGDEERTPEIMRLAGAPSIADDPDAVRWVARTSRRMGAPGDVLAFDRMWNAIDFRGVLSSIHVPTISIYRRWSADPDAQGYEDLVARIPGAKGVELPPGDHPPWVGDFQGAVDALREFVQTTKMEEAEFDRVLASILFTDIVDSTSTAARLGDREWASLVERHHQIVRGLLSRYRGAEVDTAGDGFFATFDGPARAVRCASSIVEAVRPIGIQVRAGIHTGEAQTIDGKIGGLAVSIGARVGSLASPSEILVSQTVKDLVAGSGLVFEDVGEHELKGVPDRWRLYRVVDER